MKGFKVSGHFLMGRGPQKFTKEVLAEDEEGAREQIFSILGSKHRTTRKGIQIESIEEINKDAAKDLYVKGKLGG